MKALHIATFILVIIGALNWGLIGLFKFNLVMALFGSWPTVEQIIYILVGISAVYLVIAHTKDCKTCMMGKK